MDTEHNTTNTQPTSLVVAVRARRTGPSSLIRRCVASIADFSRRLTRKARGAEDPHDNALITSREWLQSAGVAIDVLFSIAEAIPVFGPSIKGAMEALYKVLQLIEARYQIQEDTQALMKRINVLLGEIGRYPDRLLMQHLERITSELKGAAGHLELLLRKKRLKYSIIVSTIAQWNARIDSCVADCTLFIQLELSVATRAREIVVESITLVDPLGLAQILPRPEHTSLSILAQSVLERYGSNPDFLSLLRGFLDKGNFEIILGEALGAITLQPELLPYLRDGTRLVMRVVTFQRATHKQKTILCPSCGKDIPVKVKMNARANERVSCSNCNRRVQTETALVAEETALDHTYSDGSQDCKLLQNITVKLRLGSSRPSHADDGQTLDHGRIQTLEDEQQSSNLPQTSSPSEPQFLQISHPMSPSKDEGNIESFHPAGLSILRSEITAGESDRSSHVVAIVGNSGSGRSSARHPLVSKITFINAVIGKDVAPVHQDSESCTREVAEYTYQLPDDGGTVDLVDTPAFDAYHSGVEMPTAWKVLDELIAYKKPFSHILIFQSISDEPLDDFRGREKRRFLRLCTPNVEFVIVTTKWDEALGFASEGGAMSNEEEENYISSSGLVALLKAKGIQVSFRRSGHKAEVDGYMAPRELIEDLFGFRASLHILSEDC